MKCSVLEAQWCWYCHKHNTLGGTQSVENQVGQQEGPAEYFLLVDFSKLGDVLIDVHICVTVVRSSFLLVKPLYGILEMTLISHIMWT